MTLKVDGSVKVDICILILRKIAVYEDIGIGVRLLRS